MNCIRKFIIYLCTAAPLFSSFAARPFTTDDAGTVKSGCFEAETGIDFSNDVLNAGFGLKHGLTEKMDIGIGFSYAALPEVTRCFDNLEIGLKFSFIADLFALSASVLPGETGFCLNGIISRAFGPVGIDLNCGMEAAGYTDNALATWNICSHIDQERFSAGIECGGTHEEISFWQLGGNLSITEWLTFDIGVNGGFSSDSEIGGTAGFTFAFPVQSEQ